MSWWYVARFDKRRLKRVLRELSGTNLELYGMWLSVYEKGDTQELELARLMLADMVEESGEPVVAKMIREWTTCVPPKERKRKRR